uniref:Calcium-responsive transactivator n=1 Tax=Anthurium amnicola TaxID=1678845 RepID=A0A1D1YX61_9ARAE
MQQRLMQQHPMMAYANHPSNVTTDLIQQYLDENKQLILAILDNQNSGKMDECAVNQAKLQRNLMYLAAIADSQPQMPTIAQQFPPNSLMQSGTRFGQPQQPQLMTPQSLMVARSPVLYAQSSLSALQQHQQQQQQELHSQLGMCPGGNNELHMLHGQSGVASSRTLTAGGFSDFGHNSSTGKQEIGGSTEGRGGSSGVQSGDGSESLYMKGSEEGK